MEIDGGGGRQKKRRGKRNTINGHGISSWRIESPLELMHCGEVSRLGAVRSNEVGQTRKSDAEICDFVANYLSKHPTYHMMTENCQDFAYAIVEYNYLQCCKYLQHCKYLQCCNYLQRGGSLHIGQ